MLFGLSLGHLLCGASEPLFKSLQAKDTSLQEGLSAVNLCKDFYDRQRKEESFNCFYDKVVKTGQDLKIDPPRLPCYRRAPVRNEDGSFPHRYSSPREYFRHHYYQACDLLHQELENRISQTGLLLPLFALESLLLNASNGLSFQEQLDEMKVLAIRMTSILIIYRSIYHFLLMLSSKEYQW